ncbi:MAG: Hsp20/alpha crystallin family protein [Planctomycetales bacterium]|nr:Hsp20/alpha crystallin family protein [Planctomycetales bacterium]
MLPTIMGRNRLVPRSLESMERDFNEMFSRMFGPQPEAWLAEALEPRLNVSETEKAFEIAAEMPGVDPKDFHVQVEGDSLVISGEKREEKEDKKEEKGRVWHTTERRYGSFRRMIPLPVGVDVAKVEAEYKDGVLHVSMPKSAEVKPHKIEVKKA